MATLALTPNPSPPLSPGSQPMVCIDVFRQRGWHLGHRRVPLTQEIQTQQQSTGTPHPSQHD